MTAMTQHAIMINCNTYTVFFLFWQFLDVMVDNLKDVLKSGLFERAQLMVSFNCYSTLAVGMKILEKYCGL